MQIVMRFKIGSGKVSGIFLVALLFRLFFVNAYASGGK